MNDNKERGNDNDASNVTSSDKCTYDRVVDRCCISNDMGITTDEFDDRYTAVTTESLADTKHR